MATKQQLCFTRVISRSTMCRRCICIFIVYVDVMGATSLQRETNRPIWLTFKNIVKHAHADQHATSESRK